MTPPTVATDVDVESDWIEWAGGEMPVTGDTMVDVRCVNGSEYGLQPAARLRWKHIGKAHDIRAYRESVS